MMNCIACKLEKKKEEVGLECEHVRCMHALLDALWRLDLLDE